MTMAHPHLAVAALTLAATLASMAARPSDRVPLDRPVLFASDRTGDFELYVRLPDATEVALTDNGVSDFDARWAPDGRRIAWIRGDRAAAELWIAELDITGRDARLVPGSDRQVTTNDVLDIDPAWTPDGQGIVVSRGSSGGFGDEDLWLVDLAPAPDPDGQDPDPGVPPLPLPLPPDGSGTSDTSVAERRLTSSSLSDRDPALSPDGTRLVFARGKSGDDGTDQAPSDLHVMSLDVPETAGGAVHNLTAHLDRSASTREHRARWTWFAGEERIVFAKWWGGGGASTLWSMRPDGSDARELTPGNRVATYPSPMADGRVVYDEVRKDTNSDLYLLEGSSTIRLTKTTGRDTTPDVQP